MRLSWLETMLFTKEQELFIYPETIRKVYAKRWLAIVVFQEAVIDLVLKQEYPPDACSPGGDVTAPEGYFLQQ